MADHSKPLVTSTYANFVTELDGRFDDIAKGLDPATTTPTNLPTGSIRWNSASSKWEKWSGTAWADLAASYNINLAGPLTLVANSSSDALRITQTGAGNCLVVEDSANPDSTPFVINTSGTVVAGNTGAIGIAGGTPQIQNHSTGAGGSLVSTTRWAAVTGAGGFSIAHSRGATIGAYDSLVSGDTFGSLSFQGADGTGFIEGASIIAYVDGTPGTNDMPGRLVFSTTADGASTPTERMRITSAGNVGLGATTPAAKFEISASNDGITDPLLANNRIRISDTDTAAVAGQPLGVLEFYSADASGAGVKAYIAALSNSSAPDGNLIFATQDSVGGTGEAMRIRYDKNIAIGGVGLPTVTFYNQKNITGGVTAYANYTSATVGSDVTANAYLYRTNAGTTAAAFTLGTLQHYRADQGTIGAGSAVTSQYGFFASSNLTGATNNYGVYADIASGTGRYNFYAAGTAQNLFSGDVLVFGAGRIGYSTGSGGAITQATSRTNGVTINKTNGAITLVSAAGSATYQSFTVTNSTVAATDTIIVNQKSGTDLYKVFVTAVAAGSFRITFATTGGTTTEQPVFNFAVIKAVTA